MDHLLLGRWANWVAERRRDGEGMASASTFQRGLQMVLFIYSKASIRHPLGGAGVGHFFRKVREVDMFGSFSVGRYGGDIFVVCFSFGFVRFSARWFWFGD